ncbi:hypothetical protein SEEN202_23424 [Salmonella enterica subsp. enterica serovar Newport str. CVM 35202]|nr:hypothetical protein SEEN202_23424 [Salmonella enterica subsp. enterica serovar Newport str. CVM 35202]
MEYVQMDRWYAVSFAGLARTYRATCSASSLLPVSFRVIRY